MKPVLVIAYLFPPLGGGGVQRTLGFVKHLPRHGWRPIVVAAEAPDYWAMDESLVAEIPDSAEVHRVKDRRWLRPLDVLRRFLPADARSLLDALAYLPDRQITWLPTALFKALRVGQGAKAIFSTSTPFTDHLVALLAKRISGLPWVADFRDPWTQNQTFAPATALHAQAHRFLEEAVYRDADLIVANTALNRAALWRDFPATRDKSIHLPNGFDEDDFGGLALPPRSTPWRIGYAGSFYSKYGPARWFALLEAAHRLAPAVVDPIGLRFLGKTGEIEPPPWLAPRVEVLGYLEKRAALEALADCDASLVLLPPSDGPSGWVPQKLYVGLRLGRPILALVPEGEVASIVRAAGGGSAVIDPDHPGAPQALVDWIDLRRQEAPPPFDAGVVAKYDRGRQGRALAEALDRLAP